MKNTIKLNILKTNIKSIICIIWLLLLFLVWSLVPISVKVIECCTFLTPFTFFLLFPFTFTSSLYIYIFSPSLYLSSLSLSKSNNFTTPSLPFNLLYAHYNQVSFIYFNIMEIQNLCKSNSLWFSCFDVFFYFIFSLIRKSHIFFSI